jgi:hypothetical protein
MIGYPMPYFYGSGFGFDLGHFMHVPVPATTTTPVVSAFIKIKNRASFLKRKGKLKKKCSL